MRNKLALEKLVAKVNAGSFDIDEAFENKNLSISFVNPYSVYIANRNEKYISDLQLMDAVFADGILLAKAIGFFRKTKVKRLSFDGNSIADYFLKKASSMNYTVALVGGVSGVAESAAKIFEKEYGIIVCDTNAGFFDSPESRISYFSRILIKSPDVLIVGMGAPYQDRLLIELKELGWRGLGVTCGGYLDQVTSSGVKYYPDWVEKYNLRAIYRLVREPRRLWRRYFLEYFDFYKEFSIMFGRKSFGLF